MACCERWPNIKQFNNQTISYEQKFFQGRHAATC